MPKITHTQKSVRELLLKMKAVRLVCHAGKAKSGIGHEADNCRSERTVAGPGLNGSNSPIPDARWLADLGQQYSSYLPLCCERR
jgi:hypothetical protein